MRPLLLQTKGESAERFRGGRSRFRRYNVSSREASGDNAMVLTGETLAVLDLHHLPGPRMKRIEDQNLERRTPGIVTLS